MCHSEPFTVIPSEARNLALPVQGKLREESRTSLRFQSEIPRFARNDIRTGVEGVGDLASLPIVLLVLTVLVFVASPAINGISRHYEHQADQFGLEVAYGIVADPNTADVQSFQISGEEDLEDPDPNPFVRFWLYTHPPLEERIRFAASYRPWTQGKPLEFVPTPRE